MQPEQRRLASATRAQADPPAPPSGSHEQIEQQQRETTAAVQLIEAVTRRVMKPCAGPIQHLVPMARRWPCRT